MKHEVAKLFQIVEKKKLNDAVTMVRIAAPLIAKRFCRQFIIFRLDEFGERVPLTVATATARRNHYPDFSGCRRAPVSLQPGSGRRYPDLVGPLGVPTELPEGWNRFA
ncbi:MAG: hypothetical protein ACLSFT_07070 [Ruminococcus callidus]